MRPKVSKVVVLGAVFNQRGELLVSQRYDPKIPEAHMKWDFIGGANEFGESLEETLHRELDEEAGVVVEIQEFLPQHVSRLWSHEQYDQHTLVFCFSCKLISEKRRKKEKKIHQLAWRKLEDLDEIEFLPTCHSFLTYLRNK